MWVPSFHDPLAKRRRQRPFLSAPAVVIAGLLTIALGLAALLLWRPQDSAGKWACFAGAGSLGTGAGILFDRIFRRRLHERWRRARAVERDRIEIKEDDKATGCVLALCAGGIWLAGLVGLVLGREWKLLLGFAALSVLGGAVAWWIHRSNRPRARGLRGRKPSPPRPLDHSDDDRMRWTGGEG